MRHRRLVLLLLLSLSFTAGCINATPDDEVREPQIISIAVGAEVTLELGDSRCDELATACLSDNPRELIGVSLSSSGPIELVDSSFDGRAVFATVRALAPGETVLVVEHQSFRETFRDEIILRAIEITHVAAEVRCQDRAEGRSHYALTPGAQFFVGLVAMADETLLASGSLELIADAVGFEVFDPPEDDSRRVLAPTMPGDYEWTLLGTASPPLQFVVYEPAQLGVRLTEAGSGLMPSAVTLERVIDGVAVCVHEGSTRAVVEVTDGSCLTAVHDFEFVGPLPVDLGDGDVVVGLTGAGSCTVTATLDDGSNFGLSIEVDNPAASIEPGNGQPIGTEASAVGGALQRGEQCTRVTNLTNGTCEIIDVLGYVLPDGDCFLDWDWTVEHRDGTGDEETERVESQPVGVGLLTELRLGIIYEFIFLDIATLPPNGLATTLTPETGLYLESLGCIDSDRESLAVRAETAGSWGLRFEADNAYDSGGASIRARDVAAVRFETEGGQIVNNRVLHFIGSETRISASYVDASGVQLRGIAPIMLSSDDATAEASIRLDRLFTGTAPNTITLASDVAPQTLPVIVVDESAVLDVGGLSGHDGPIGEQTCFTPHAIGSDGARIHGTSPVRPQVSLTGDAFVVRAGWPRAEELCLVGFETGSTTVKVDWGPATTQQSWVARLISVELIRS